MLIARFTAVNLYSGEYVVYQRGDINNPRIMPREWKNSDFNFDDVSKGMLTLFTVATFEGWPGCVTSLASILLSVFLKAAKRLKSTVGVGSLDIVWDLEVREMAGILCH